MTPTLTVLGTLATKRLAAARAADEARGPHVGGLHRAADVGDEHDRGALDRHRDGLLRPRGGQDEDRQREQEDQHRHVAAPARAVRAPPTAVSAGAAKAAAARRRSRWLRAVEGDEHAGWRRGGRAPGARRSSRGEGDEAHGVRAGRFCSVASSVTSWPVRSTRISMSSPGCWLLTMRETSAEPLTAWPSISVMTSPGSTPALSAGPPGVTVLTSAPDGALGSVGSEVSTPRHGRAILSPRLQARDDLAHGVRRHGEADADVALRVAGGGDLRVDADDAAGLVEQRAARVAGVDRRVGLDDLVDREAVGRL